MLPIGKVVKSFGADGGLLLSAGVDPETLDFKEPVFITFDGLQVPFFILDCTPKGNRFVVHLNDVGNLEDAEEMVGRTIYADIESDAEEDFTGWTVFDREHRIGTCNGIEDIPGNPCLEVQIADSPDNADPVLIPLHEDFIAEADEVSRTLYLILPEGLY